MNILELAKQAGMFVKEDIAAGKEDTLERFAALVREECAKAVEDCRYVDYKGRVLSCGPDLPANEEIEKCAAAIRGMADKARGACS